MPLISQAEKEALSNLLHETLHESFALDITVYKAPTFTVISTEPDHNFAFPGSSTNTGTETTVQPVTFKARILFGKKQNIDAINNNSTDNILNIALADGEVRIKVMEDGYEHLKDAKRVKIGDKLFSRASNPRPHGLFIHNAWTFHYKEID